MENRPTLLPGLDFYLNAYRDLQYDRPIGQMLGSIPWSSVIKWCHVHEIYDINDIDSILNHIRALEKAEYDFNEKRKKGN